MIESSVTLLEIPVEVQPSKQLHVSNGIDPIGCRSRYPFGNLVRSARSASQTSHAGCCRCRKSARRSREQLPLNECRFLNPKTSRITVAWNSGESTYHHRRLCYDDRRTRYP